MSRLYTLNILYHISHVLAMKELGEQMGPFLLMCTRVIFPLLIGLIFQNLFHVPKISYNLLSIGKITKDLHCQVILSPNTVSF